MPQSSTSTVKASSVAKINNAGAKPIKLVADNNAHVLLYQSTQNVRDIEHLSRQGSIPSREMVWFNGRILIQTTRDERMGKETYGSLSSGVDPSVFGRR
jgi:hypothetical protein